MKWQIIEREIISIEQENCPLGPSDTSPCALALVSRARFEMRRRPKTMRWAAVGGLAAAAGIAGLFVLMSLAQEQPSASFEKSAALLGTSSTVTQDGQVVRGELRAGQSVSAPVGGKTQMKLGGDRAVLRADSLVRIDAAGQGTTRLVLSRGQVACAVERRRAGETFEVESGRVRVVVMGTRFSVTREGDGSVSVAVDAGEVQVFAADHRYSVLSGFGLRVGLQGDSAATPLLSEERDQLSELLDSPLDSVVPALTVTGEEPNQTTDWGSQEDTQGVESTRDAARSGLRQGLGGNKQRSPLRSGHDRWRTAILEGRLDVAATALREHLEGHPRDVEAWFLLADCERKSGRWQPAIEAYRQIGELGSKQERQRAVYRSGAIWQDKLGDHRQAARLFEQYLAQSGGKDTMKAEATLRLARAYLGMGRKSEATPLLDSVVQNHQGTSAAEQAMELLQSRR
jgi:TolA-binding protein